MCDHLAMHNVHDLETVRMQRDKLLAALKQVFGSWPSEDELRVVIAEAVRATTDGKYQYTLADPEDGDFLTHIEKLFKTNDRSAKV